MRPWLRFICIIPVTGLHHQHVMRMKQHTGTHVRIRKHADRHRWRRWSLRTRTCEDTGRRNLGEEVVDIVLKDVQTLFVGAAVIAERRRRVDG